MLGIVQKGSNDTEQWSCSVRSVQLQAWSPTSCKLHLETLKNDFVTLREKEIEFYKEELVNNQATVENDDCTPAVVLNKSYFNT